MTLTVQEIIDLARFAGIALDESRLPDADDMETPIAVEKCPPEGLIDDDGSRLHYRMCASLDEYPEEGRMGLGPQIKEKESGDLAEHAAAATPGAGDPRHAAIMKRLEMVKPHAEAITVFLYAVRDASQIVAEAHVPQKENDDGFKWRLSEAFLDNYIND